MYRRCWPETALSSGARDEKSCVSSVLQKRHGGMMVDHVLIDRAPGQDRALLMQGDRVVEVLADYQHARNLTGSIHRVKIERVIAGQNRAFARLADGTPVSIRLATSDRAAPGTPLAVTIMAAPRDGKAWQASLGARLVSANLVMLAGQQGITLSRALAASLSEGPKEALVDALASLLAEKGLAEGVALIVRRGAGLIAADALVAECWALADDWLAATGGDKASGRGSDDIGVLYDGGGIAAQARCLAPLAKITETDGTAAAAEFDNRFDQAIDEACQSSVQLDGGGVMWVEPTKALTAIDLDSGTGTQEALFAAVPAAIARALRLRQIGGLVAIDLPRAKPPVMRRVRDDLDMALAAIPRSPEILGQTRGGVLECRLAYGHPFPTDLGGRMASEVLGVLRQIAWRPTMAAPAIEISPAMADWLDTEGGPALAALDRPVRRIVLSGLTVPGLVEPEYD